MKRIFLAALLAASAMLAGCGAPETETAPARRETEATPAQPESSERYPAGTELTIAAFLQNNYLDYAAQEFMNRHPEVKVTVNLYSSETERDLTKYRQTLNTAMTGGGGEDIIDISKLDWQRFAESEMLLDLNEGLKVDDKNYFMNVLDGFLYEGKRMALPMDFVLNGYQINKAGEASGEDITELTLEGIQYLAEKYPETALFSGGGSGMSAEGLAELIFYRGMDKFINIHDKTVSMDDGEFEEVLNTIKSVADTVGHAESRLDVTEDGASYLLNQYAVYSPAMTSDGTIDLTGVFPLVYDGKVSYTSNSFIPSVNANTKNKELAMSFLQFMISDEMMLSPEILFCTVNKNVIEEKSRLTYESVVAEGYAPEGFTEETLEKNIKNFIALASRSNAREFYDANIRDFLYEDLTSFFWGNVNASEICASLQSKISTYINE